MTLAHAYAALVMQAMAAIIVIGRPAYKRGRARIARRRACKVLVAMSFPIPQQPSRPGWTHTVLVICGGHDVIVVIICPLQINKGREQPHTMQVMCSVAAFRKQDGDSSAPGLLLEPPSPPLLMVAPASGRGINNRHTHDAIWRWGTKLG